MEKLSRGDVESVIAKLEHALKLLLADKQLETAELVRQALEKLKAVRPS